LKNRSPSAESLVNDPEYRLVRELGFDEMIPFVLENIRKKGIMSFLYFASCTVLILWMILQILYVLSGDLLAGKQVLFQIIIGTLAGSFLVIPVHELIHGLAYRILGARKIIFGSDLKQFIFFVTADRYPVSGLRIIFLALLPFAVINAVTIFIVVAYFPEKIIFGGFFLLSHNIMCIGDFAISNYVRLSEKSLYSFDVPEEKKSYFYERTGDY
jgi:hypothetical protein